MAEGKGLVKLRQPFGTNGGICAPRADALVRNFLAIGAFTVLLALFAVSGRAQELYGLGGERENDKSHADTYAWQIEYMERLADHLSWSFSYLNEGHVLRHYRDGAVSQFWAHTEMLGGGFSLAAGLGAYRYFDTTPSNGSYADDHGWGVISSVAATWRLHGPWLLQLRGNWIHSERDVDNLSVLAGIGYELEPTNSVKEQISPERPANEVTLFLGQAMSNSFGSEPSVAEDVEYRRRLAPFLEWTVSSIYEGDNGAENRGGLATQLWVVRSFFDERLTLGIGGGPYFVVDTYHPGTDKTVVALFSMTASYRFMPHWSVRVSWNRVTTNYNSDSDVILGGIGYLF